MKYTLEMERKYKKIEVKIEAQLFLKWLYFHQFHFLLFFFPSLLLRISFSLLPLTFFFSSLSFFLFPSSDQSHHSVSCIICRKTQILSLDWLKCLFHCFFFPISLLSIFSVSKSNFLSLFRSRDWVSGYRSFPGYKACHN